VIAAALLDGHVLLADWLFLIAAVLFVVTAVGIVVRETTWPALVPLGLALVAVGWLVL
jgi:NADH:ubiquinone oxidoreductase subunit K